MTFDLKTHSVIINALGMENLPPERQADLLELSGVLIYQAVVTRALEEMPDDVVNEFEKVVEGEPTPEILLAFFKKNIPDFDRMIQEEAKAYMERGTEAPSEE